MNNRYNTSSGWGIEITPTPSIFIAATARLQNTDQMYSVLASSGSELQMQLVRAGVTAKPDEWQQFIQWVDSAF